MSSAVETRKVVNDRMAGCGWLRTRLLAVDGEQSLLWQLVVRGHWAFCPWGSPQPSPYCAAPGNCGFPVLSAEQGSKSVPHSSCLAGEPPTSRVCHITSLVRDILWAVFGLVDTLLARC